MLLSEIFRDYAAKITQIHLYQRAMQELSKRELVELQKYEDLVKANPTIGKYPVAAHNMFFRSALDGEQRYFGRSRSSIEDRRRAVVLHKNKQYQWLLAEAYEEFEDYLITIYAWSGYNDHNFWPLRDFGNSTLMELNSHNFLWFKEQAKRKKDVPSSILSTLRGKYPEISALEASNEIGVNLRLAVTLIEMLRHVIVHNAGVTESVVDFQEKVLKKAGLYNNGKYEQQYSNFIIHFFGTGKYSNTIMLIEVAAKDDSILNLHYNIFEILSNYLMAYAHLICEIAGSGREKPAKENELSRGNTWPNKTLKL